MTRRMHALISLYLWALLGLCAAWTLVGALGCAPLVGDAEAVPVQQGCRPGMACTMGGATIVSSSASCLVVDGTVLRVDCANNRVGVNKAPAVPFDVSGDVFVDGGLTVSGTSSLKGAVTAPSVTTTSTAYSPTGLSVPTNGFLGLNGGASPGAYLTSSGSGELGLAVGGTREASLTSTAFAPGAAGGNSLGSGAVPWLDLQLSGSVHVGSGIDAGTLYVSGGAAFGGQDAGAARGASFNATSTNVNPAALSVPTSGYLALNGENMTGAHVSSSGTGQMEFGVSGNFEAKLTATEFAPYAAAGLALGSYTQPFDAVYVRDAGTVYFGTNTAADRTDGAYITWLPTGIDSQPTGSFQVDRPWAACGIYSGVPGTCKSGLDGNGNQVSGMVVAFAGFKHANGSIGKPTCNSGNRGVVWMVFGGAGVADTYEICTKSSADAYAYRTIVTTP